MKKNSLKVTLLASFVLCLCTVSVSAAEIAQPSTHNVYVNGEKIEVGAYTINGNNYFKLRDLAMMLNGTDAQFDVAWNADNNTIAIWADKAYTPVGGEIGILGGKTQTAQPTEAKVIYYKDTSASGKEIDLAGYEVGWNNYFGLRDLASCLGFTVQWSEAAQRVDIHTAGYVQPGNEEKESASAEDSNTHPATTGNADDETITITLRGRVTYNLVSGPVQDGYGGSRLALHPAKNAELILYIGHLNFWQYVEVGPITTDDNGFFEITTEINPRHAETILSYYCVAGNYVGVDGNTYFSMTYDHRFKRTIQSAHKLEELRNLQDGDTFVLRDTLSPGAADKTPDELWASSILLLKK